MLQAEAHKAYLQNCDLHGCLSDLRAESDTKKENFSHYKDSCHKSHLISFLLYSSWTRNKIKLSSAVTFLWRKFCYLHSFFSIFPQKEHLDSHLTKINLINSQCSIIILITFSHYFYRKQSQGPVEFFTDLEHIILKSIRTIKDLE